MLPYGKQLIDQDDIDAVVRVLRSDFLTTGPEVPAFEQALRQALDSRHAVACANGTAALHLVCLSLGLAPGDQVIVPTISFVATANAARYCGAEVIFADVDADTSLMTPETLGEALTRADRSRLKAVIVVHMGGHPADMPDLQAIARENGLVVIEDACHALGSTYDGPDGVRYKIGACAHSDFAVLSLHPVKTITCGEGGVVLTPHPEHAKNLQMLRSHGLTRDGDDWSNTGLGFDGAAGAENPWYYEQQSLGFNYRLTDFQAALAGSQLSKLPAFAARRRRLMSLYRDQIGAGSNILRLVPQSENTDPSLHLAVALIDFQAIGKSRREVMNGLRTRDIGTQVHYIPIHRQPYYQQAGPAPSLPQADRYYDRCLSLPLYPGMSDADVGRVVAALSEVVGG